MQVETVYAIELLLALLVFSEELGVTVDAEMVEALAVRLQY
jgi:hypothetical protein